MKRIATALAATAALALSVAPATAGAAPKDKAQAQVLGTVVTQADGTARVTARYTCPEGFHLWVSAKQTADRARDAALEGEGSSQLSAAWLQSHPAPSQFTCDGKWRTGTFQIDTAEQGFGELGRGMAWVQFCLIGERTFLSENRWVAVR